MSDEPRGLDVDGDALLRRATDASARRHRALAGAIRDRSIAPAGRLDDRHRAALDERIAVTLDEIARELAELASRRLASGDPGAAAMLPDAVSETVATLAGSAALDDPLVLGELIEATGLDLLATAMVPVVAGEDEAPRTSLVVRLADCADQHVAAAARALLAAGNLRRPGSGSAAALPAEPRHRLTWAVAAALGSGRVPAVEQALADAAGAALAGHDEGGRVESCALRLAQAIDARPGELAELLGEALDDCRPLLFVACLARAAGLTFEVARSVTLDRDPAALVVLLHALSLDREAIARIGVSLAAGDAARDLQQVANALDALAQLPAGAADAVLATLRLPADYRRASAALASRRPRR